MRRKLERDENPPFFRCTRALAEEFSWVDSCQKLHGADRQIMVWAFLPQPPSLDQRSIWSGRGLSLDGGNHESCGVDNARCFMMRDAHLSRDVTSLPTSLQLRIVLCLRWPLERTTQSLPMVHALLEGHVVSSLPWAGRTKKDNRNLIMVQSCERETPPSDPIGVVLPL
ncbi:uncharacterized protein BJX67DRAFT_213868 [Aspergillus lucknowensis]|uniref:Uncharacterized protein n=1 Tax=Aspergillus lucknowensis TaxID=176173 RepID=A0ABR4M3A2_9EURO